MDVKVYKYDQFQLKLCYQELTALKITKRDVLPHYFCYECAILLHKFVKFKQKCYEGQKELRALLVRGKITHDSVRRLKLKSTKFKPTLEVLTLNKRVRTFTFTDRKRIRRKLSECVEAVVTASSPEIVSAGEENEGSEERNTDTSVDIPETVPDDVKDEPNDLIFDLHEEADDPDDLDFNPAEDNAMSLTTVFITEKEILKTEEVVVEQVDETNGGNDVAVDKYAGLIARRRKNSVASKKDFKRRRQRKIEGVRNNWGDRKYKFTVRQRRCLDLNKWRKISLTEEEAVREFEKRASDPKYVQGTYTCKDCYKVFSKEDIMRRHMKLKHNPSIGRFECRFCRARFRLECHLRKHVRIHFTKYQCLVCNLVVAIEPTALMHEETHTGVTRTCKYCGEEFRHMSTYYTHLRTHRSRHVCASCGASFVSEAGLHQHRRVRHVDDEPRQQPAGKTYCERCQIEFETPKAHSEHLNSSALHADVEKEDNEEVPAPKRRYKRLRFGRTSKKKPTTCHQCGKHFDTQTQCMAHHYEEHPGTSFCPPNERHICEICGASLAPGSIAMHHNIHTREKLHSCETCGRQFHSTAGLKRHKVTHTGEKPYECPLCEKRFTQSNSMKLHYRTFHLKQPYPKRVRTKKKDDIQDAVPMESGEDSF
ncbi:unnamed protein product, partial [Iphiclides podalirius]